MTKIYLIQNARVNKRIDKNGIIHLGDIYSIIEGVFTNRKKAEKYKKYLEACRELGEYKKMEKYYDSIRYYITEYNISTFDAEPYLKAKLKQLKELPK